MAESTHIEGVKKINGFLPPQIKWILLLFLISFQQRPDSFCLIKMCSYPVVEFDIHFLDEQLTDLQQQCCHVNRDQSLRGMRLKPC